MSDQFHAGLPASTLNPFVKNRGVEAFKPALSRKPDCIWTHPVGHVSDLPKAEMLAVSPLHRFGASPDLRHRSERHRSYCVSILRPV
jgi:hypothetical protein